MFKILAPCSGSIVSLEQINDATFSGRMLGDGIAINPSSGTIFAPFDGIITTLHKNRHALTIKSEEIEVLIHIGLDTVNLNGEGFTAYTSAGKEVKKGEKLLTFDKHIIEKNGYDAAIVVIVLQPENAGLTKTTEPFVRENETCILSINANNEDKNPTDENPGNNDESVFSQTIIIRNKNGLHARPAGRLAKIASEFAERIEIEKDGIRVSAKSVTGILSLDVRKNDVVTIHASGKNARQAIETIIAGINEAEEEVHRPEAINTTKQEAVDFSKENIKITGTPINRGIVFGKAYWLKNEANESTSIYKGFEEEIRTLQNAIQKATEELEKEIGAASADSHKEILRAHLQILHDPYLTETAENHIKQKKTAANAFSKVIRQSISSLEKTSNAFIKERTGDYKDIERRVLHAISGKTTTIPQIPENSIVFAGEFLPGDIAALANKAKGVVSAKGSPTSHASIMLKNAGIPAIINTRVHLSEAISGKEVFLNATEGYAIINPAKEIKTETLKTIEETDKIDAINKKNAHEKAVTKDGVEIRITGNIGSAEEATTAIDNGAEGIGLVRTEFLFLHHTTVPTEEEQIERYREITTNAGNKPVTFRLFDISEDKPLPFFRIPEEGNTSFRGVRAYPENEAIIRTQIRALLHANSSQQIRILIPMVSEVSEIIYVNKLIEEEQQQLQYPAAVPVGMMIEIPNAVLMMKQFAPHVDFFSVGTNDLSQYASATDRQEVQDNMYLNPGFLNLIRIIGETATFINKPVSVCGSMSGEFAAIPFLIGFGITELACPGGAIPGIKAFIRELDFNQCKNAAYQALELSNAKEVKDCVKETASAQPQKAEKQEHKKKSGSSSVMKQFIRLGKSLMLPIAVLPVAGLLLRLGQADLLNIPFLAESGNAIFKNLPVIFALGVAIGYAKDNHGAAPLSAFVGYVVLTYGLKILNPAIDMGVFAGIIIGIMAGVFYNKFNTIQLPPYLAFFGGKRFIPIITGTSALFIALIASVVWPPVQSGINWLGDWIIQSKSIGLFIYGTANRLLIPLGLHHILNNLVWFVFGSYPAIQSGAEVAVHGDLHRFFADDPTAGAFMSGFFPVMMFGLPAACFAMILQAKSARKKAVSGILLSMALTSFLTGVTEPIEFSFMFLAFPLYVLHAVLTGLSMVIMDLLNIKLGFTFSAGLFDFVLNWKKATNPELALLVGLIYGVVYFFVFYFAIKIWNLKTLGREDETEVNLSKADKTSVQYRNTKNEKPDVSLSRGAKYLQALGGKGNIKNIDNCITRLRLEIFDKTKVNETQLKSLGAKGVLYPGEGLLQVIIGPEADVIAGEIRKMWNM